MLEHITTAEAVAVRRATPGPTSRATVTPQHLIINRNAIFAGGLRPHAYCLPVAKREQHRLAVRKAATSGSPKFFLGTDSAPHARHAKESACGCAGIFNAPFALESYATVFEEEGALDSSRRSRRINGAALLRPAAQRRDGHARADRGEVPDEVEGLVPFHAGETLGWRWLRSARQAHSYATIGGGLSDADDCTCDGDSRAGRENHWWGAVKFMKGGGRMRASELLSSAVAR